MPEKMSAPHRLSSLVLLFLAHVAYRNFYPNRVLIPTHSSLDPKGLLGENTGMEVDQRHYLISAKNVLYLPTQFQTSLSQVIAPCSYPLASELPSVDYLVG